MNDFKIRQIKQIIFAISDFRKNQISLSLLSAKLEGAARAVGQDFWEQYLSEIISDIDETNAYLIENRRTLNSAEAAQIKALLSCLEIKLNSIN